MSRYYSPNPAPEAQPASPYITKAGEWSSPMMEEAQPQPPAPPFPATPRPKGWPPASAPKIEEDHPDPDYKGRDPFGPRWLPPRRQ